MYRSKLIFLSVRWQKTALLQAWVVHWVVRLANVPFARGHSISLFLCVAKNSHTVGSSMSVGLLVVRLLYCFYVFGHLSKLFTFSVFLSALFCRVVVFYACTQGLAICSGWLLKTLLST